MKCIVRNCKHGGITTEFVLAEKAFVGNIFVGRFGGLVAMIEVLEVL